VIARIRALLTIDSAVCLVGGAAVTLFAGPLARGLGVDGTVVTRSVGVFLVGYGVILAVLARGGSQTLVATARLSALADASWVMATAVLVSAGAFSTGGDVTVALAAIPVAALGVGKVVALRSSSTVRLVS
jgi:hypothetical protein